MITYVHIDGLSSGLIGDTDIPLYSCFQWEHWVPVWLVIQIFHCIYVFSENIEF